MGHAASGTTRVLLDAVTMGAYEGVRAVQEGVDALTPEPPKIPSAPAPSVLAEQKYASGATKTNAMLTTWQRQRLAAMRSGESTGLGDLGTVGTGKTLLGL
jgi:hypothetical protein